VYAGAFELALIRASQLYSPESDSIIMDQVRVPCRLFAAADDPEEKRLIAQAFGAVRSLTGTYLNDTQVAVYSAMVLMNPRTLGGRKSSCTNVCAERPGIKSVSVVTELRDRINECLTTELHHTHPHTVDAPAALHRLEATLHQVAQLHVHVLARFRANNQTLLLPALYTELFSSD
jgi:hypothetical protein